MDITRIRIIAVVLFGVFCLVVPNAFGAEYFSPEVDRLFSDGVSHVQNERFSQALENFSKIQELMPEHPLGYFLKAAVYQDITSNYRSDHFADEFKKEIKTAIKLSKSMIKKDKNDPMGYFFLGGSYGYKGLQQKEFGLWFSAFRNGLKGVKQLKKTIALDPDIYDCYYGIGSYHYWRVVKGKILKFLGIYSDTREQGIEEIRLAADKGRYARWEARMALTRVYLSEEQPDKAMEVIAEIESRLEQDMYSAWFKGYIFISRKDWQAALDAFDYVEKLLDAQTFSGQEAYAECYYAKSLCFLHLGQIEKAREKFEWIKERKPNLRKTDIINEIRRNLSDLEDEIEEKEKNI